MEFIQHSGMYKIGDSTRYAWKFLLFWNVPQTKNVSSATECPVLKGLFSIDVTAKLLLYQRRRQIRRIRHDFHIRASLDSSEIKKKSSYNVTNIELSLFSYLCN